MTQNHRSAYQDVLAGGEPVAFRRGQIDVADRCSTELQPTLVFPGAFNPLHDGHRVMSHIASKIHGVETAFEISVRNVDKKPMGIDEVQRRLEQDWNGARVWLSDCTTFSQKSAYFPNCTFVVGADTLSRIASLKYYQSESKLVSAIHKIASRGCRFLAFGRVDAGGVFQTASHLEIPPPLRDIVDEVPEDQFRSDLSSTSIRQNTREKS